jgi:hypothetical protein
LLAKRHEIERIVNGAIHLRHEARRAEMIEVHEVGGGVSVLRYHPPVEINYPQKPHP